MSWLRLLGSYVRARTIGLVGGGKVLGRHGSIHFVHSSSTTTLLEMRIEQISPVTATRHTVVNEQLNDHFECSFLAVGNVLTAVAGELSKLLQTATHGRSIRRIVSSLAFRASVCAMVPGSSSEPLIPVNSTDWLCIFAKVDRLLNGSGTLISSNSDFSGDAF